MKTCINKKSVILVLTLLLLGSWFPGRAKAQENKKKGDTYSIQLKVTTDKDGKTVSVDTVFSSKDLKAKDNFYKQFIITEEAGMDSLEHQIQAALELQLPDSLLNDSLNRMIKKLVFVGDKPGAIVLSGDDINELKMPQNVYGSSCHALSEYQGQMKHSGKVCCSGARKHGKCCRVELDGKHGDYRVIRLGDGSRITIETAKRGRKIILTTAEDEDRGEELMQLGDNVYLYSGDDEDISLKGKEIQVWISDDGGKALKDSKKIKVLRGGEDKVIVIKKRQK